jgi:hypothetical protein
MANDASNGSEAAIGNRITPCTARLSAPRPDPAEIPTWMPHHYEAVEGIGVTVAKVHYCALVQHV